jgi:soluble lytic murein transglycosylase-like protein
MQFWVECAFGWLAVCRELIWRLALLVFLVLRVLGQTSQGAMQESILHQQQAIFAAQQEAQRGSLAQQRASLQRQHQDADPIGIPPASSTSSNSFSDSFFSARWEPAPASVDMPNVRVPTSACPALAEDEVEKLTSMAAQKNSVSASLIRAVMRQESAFRPCAVSTAGAMGLMQIMPSTAETLGLDDAFSPGENVDAGARYLKLLLDRYHGDRRLALGAYNAGPNRVDNAGGIPDIPETVDYVSRILGELSDEEAADGGPDLKAPAFEMPLAPATLPFPPDASSFPRTGPEPPHAP